MLGRGHEHFPPRCFYQISFPNIVESPHHAGLFSFLNHPWKCLNARPQVYLMCSLVLHFLQISASFIKILSFLLQLRAVMTLLALLNDSDIPLLLSSVSLGGSLVVRRFELVFWKAGVMSF